MKRDFIRKILLLIWILVIFMNSLFPADVSSAQSGFVVNLFKAFFSLFKYEPDTDVLTSFIRMFAHFVEFAILGLFIKIDQHHKPYPIYLTAIIGIGIAIIDEIIQIFVPGRAFEVKDILIDSFGVVTGILFVTVILLIKSKKRKLLEDAKKS